MIVQLKRSPPRTTFLWSSLGNKHASKLTRPLLLLVQISLGTRNYFASYVHLLSKTLSSVTVVSLSLTACSCSLSAASFASFRSFASLFDRSSAC